VRCRVRGFRVGSGSRFTPYIVPVPNEWTGANGISDNGMIVGYYWDENWGALHGFIAPIQPIAMRLTLNSFLPFDHIDDPHFLSPDRVLEGDGEARTWDENGSSRTSQIMDVRNQSLGSGTIFLSGPADWANITQQYQTSTSLGVDGKLTDDARFDWTLGIPLKTDWGVPDNQAEGCSGHLIDNPNPDTVTVGVNCELQTPNGVYPAWLDPAIAYDLSMTFTFTPSPVVPYSISGCRKYFPAYEIWAAGQQIYAGPNSADPLDIMFPCESAVMIERTGTITLQ
jgi:hypothetical protein